MSRNRWTMKVMVVTVVCFLISYGSSKQIPHKDKVSFPLSVVSGYSEAFGKKFAVTEFENINLDSVNEFDIQARNTDIELRQSETKELKISLKGNYFNIKIPSKIFTTEKHGNTFKLKVNEESSKEQVLFQGRLILEVPANIKKVNLMSVSGDVYVVDAKFKEINMNTVSGDVTLSLLNDSPNININTNSGDVNLHFLVSPNITIQYISVDGSMDISDELKASAEEKGKVVLGNGKGQALIKTISGDLNVNLFYN